MNTDPYSKNAAWYDTFVEPFVAGVRRKSVTLCPPERGLRVLEIGCGTAANLIPYHNAGCRVSGIDLSPAMIAQAQKKLNGCADLRVGDAARMPYANDHFDLIVAMFTLHEMPPYLRPKVMQEAVRVLKPGGRILLSDYGPRPPHSLLGWLAKGVAFTFEMLAGGDHFKNYRDFLNRQALPPLIAGQRLVVKSKATAAGGNVALYLLSA